MILEASQSPSLLPLPLSTARLTLRELVAEDLEALREVASHPEVARFVFDGPRSEVETSHDLERMLASQRAQPRTLWELGIERSADGRLIGACDLLLEADRQAAVGFLLARDTWGCGYAAEAARALVEAGFRHLDLERVVAVCDAENDACARTLERAGFEPKGLRRDRRRSGRQRILRGFEIARSAWRASTWNRDLISSYDRAAPAYAAAFYDELDRKPFDRDLLDRFAAAVRGRGRVCDLGCGPGHIARYLEDRGVEVFGIDRSAEMVRIARERCPTISFEEGDLRSLPLRDGELAGIVAFYSLIHLARETVVTALREMTRVLAPAGELLLAVHGGEGEIHAEQFLGHDVSIDVTLLSAEEMVEYASASGLAVRETRQRPPYEQEFPTERIYLSACKAGPLR